MKLHRVNYKLEQSCVKHFALTETFISGGTFDHLYLFR